MDLTGWAGLEWGSVEVGRNGGGCFVPELLLGDPWRIGRGLG